MSQIKTHIYPLYNERVAIFENCGICDEIFSQIVSQVVKAFYI